LDLRILKDLTGQIAELRILKNLAESKADSSRRTVENKTEESHGLQENREILRFAVLAQDSHPHRCSLSLRRLQEMPPPPWQFASLSKQRGCKMGSVELQENKGDSKGQKRQNKFVYKAQGGGGGVERAGGGDA